jgi:hypothetical protein
MAHPSTVLTPPEWPVIRFIPDASYIDAKGLISGIKGQQIIEDTKGFVTDVFKLKVKLHAGKYPDIYIYMVKARRRKGEISKWVMTDIHPARSKKKITLEQPA